MNDRNRSWRRLGTMVVAAGIVLALATVARASYVATPFAISDTASQSSPENQPRVVFGNGEYLVVYTHWNSNASGDIYGAFIDPQTSQIDTFPIDEYSSSDSAPAVAYDPASDRYLLVYESRQNPTAGSDLYMRLLDGEGETLAEQFLASNSDDQLMPDVAYVGGGKFMVVWVATADAALPSDAVIMARTVSYSGSHFVLGTEALVNSGTPYVGLTHPKVAADTAGQCLVAWQWPYDSSGTPDAWEHDIQTRVLGSNGHPIGPVASIAGTSDNETMPSVAYDANDDLFLVAWQDLTVYGDRDILAALAYIVPTGQITASPAMAIAAVTNDDTMPAASWNNATGDFEVSWEAEFSPTDHDIYACSVSPLGEVGTEMGVVETVDMERNPAIARGDAGFLAVWEDEADGAMSAEVYGAMLYDQAPPPHVTEIWPGLLSVQARNDDLNQLLIWFDQPVVISATDVTVQGVRTGAHNDFVLDYNPDVSVAVLSWSGSLPDDTYVVTVHDTVTNADGLILDGEMSLSEPALPSGNGAAGGSFQGILYRLAGDISQDRSVNVVDLLLLADSWSLTTDDPGFDEMADLNGDGVVDAADLLILAEHWGRSVPAGF